MSREQLYCEPCNVSWYDDCTFWTAYRSPCAKCGENREAIINTEFSFADPRMVDGPVSYPKLPYSRSSGVERAFGPGPDHAHPTVLGL